MVKLKQRSFSWRKHKITFSFQDEFHDFFEKLCLNHKVSEEVMFPTHSTIIDFFQSQRNFIFKRSLILNFMSLASEGKFIGVFEVSLFNISIMEHFSICIVFLYPVFRLFLMKVLILILNCKYYCKFSKTTFKHWFKALTSFIVSLRKRLHWARSNVSQMLGSK